MELDCSRLSDHSPHTLPFLNASEFVPVGEMAGEECQGEGWREGKLVHMWNVRPWEKKESVPDPDGHREPAASFKVEKDKIRYAFYYDLFGSSGESCGDHRPFRSLILWSN